MHATEDSTAKSEAGTKEALALDDGAKKFQRASQWFRVSVQLLGKVARRAPLILAVSLLLLATLLAVGVWGTQRLVHATAQHTRQQVKKVAQEVGRELHNNLQILYTPTTTLATYVKLKPRWDDVVANFEGMSQIIASKFPSVWGTSSIVLMQLMPFGVVRAIYNTYSACLDQGDLLGFDIMRTAFGPGAVETIETQRMEVGGPYLGFVNSSSTGPVQLMLARLPVYVEDVEADELFGQSAGTYNCSICYNATSHTLFWGFVVVQFQFRAIEEILLAPRIKDFTFRLSAERLPILTSDKGMIVDPVAVDVEVSDSNWRLEMSPANGWTPHWQPGMLAGVILASFLISGLTLSVLVTKISHVWLLQTMLPPKAIAALQRGQGFCESFSCVTILYCDIVSYTSLAASLEPFEVVELLNEVYTIFDNLSFQHCCYKVETIGDAWLCVAGCPDYEEAAPAAVRVAKLAQDMIVATRAFVSTRGHTIRIRCGMHSGPVVAAVIGSRMPRYALYGDTVKLASQFEANSKPMAVHISDVTAKLLVAENCLSKCFDIRARGIVLIKGQGRMLCHWLHVPGDHSELDTVETTSVPAQVQEMSLKMAGFRIIGVLAEILEHSDEAASLGKTIVVDNTAAASAQAAAAIEMASTSTTPEDIVMEVAAASSVSQEALAHGDAAARSRPQKATAAVAPGVQRCRPPCSGGAGPQPGSPRSPPPAAGHCRWSPGVASPSPAACRPRLVPSPQEALLPLDGTSMHLLPSASLSPCPVPHLQASGPVLSHDTATAHLLESGAAPAPSCDPALVLRAVCVPAPGASDSGAEDSAGWEGQQGTSPCTAHQALTAPTRRTSPPSMWARAAVAHGLSPATSQGAPARAAVMALPLDAVACLSTDGSLQWQRKKYMTEQAQLPPPPPPLPPLPPPLLPWPPMLQLPNVRLPPLMPSLPQLPSVPPLK